MSELANLYKSRNIDEHIMDVDSISGIDVSVQHEMLMYTIHADTEENSSSLDTVSLFMLVVESFIEALGKMSSYYTELSTDMAEVNFTYLYQLIKYYKDNTLDLYLKGEIDSAEYTRRNTVTAGLIVGTKYNLTSVMNGMSSDMVKLNDDIVILDQVSNMIIKVLNATKPN
jgi:hypothetical protein